MVRNSKDRPSFVSQIFHGGNLRGLSLALAELPSLVLDSSQYKHRRPIYEPDVLLSVQ
jgi:hypothetical protein